MSTRTRRDWIMWGALGCALVSTAHAEYTLATASHFNEYVALAVPGALDLYVIRALQQRRDVFVAVLAMVAANVASHLITGGVLEVRWPVIAAVGAVAPIIVWRVYSLKYTRTRQELLWGTEAGPVSEPVLEADAPQSAPASIRCFYCLSEAGAECTCPSALKANEDVRTRLAPDTVPDWMHDEYPASAPALVGECTLSEPFMRDLNHKCSECGGLWGSHPGVIRKRAAHLHSVPALPPEYVSSAAPLSASDMEYVDAAREYREFMGGDTSVRGLMKHASIGQARAGRLLDYLEAEETT